MRKLTAMSLSAMLVFASCMPAIAQETEVDLAETEALVPVEEEIPEDAIEVASAEDLAAISDNLSGYYLLTADIDLGGAKIDPIGSFVPVGEEGEEAETPSEEAAFTGTFNGNGHTISNFTVGQEDGMCIGLFGCISNAVVENLTVENASAEGTIMVSDVVGYSHISTVSDVALKGGSVKAYASDMSAEGMYGGIVGAGMASMLINCEAEADIELPDNTANAGIVGGGLELTSLLNCSGTGSVTAGNNCYGLGGVSGCAFGAEDILDCTAEDVTITAGDGASWIGGITGYAGGFEDASFGVPVTAVADCTVSNITVNVPEDAAGVEDFVGAGFYSEEVAEAMGAPYDAPTVFTVENCKTA